MARKSTPIQVTETEPISLEQAFGLVLRERRIAKGLTLVQMEGDDAYVNSYISQVERGITTPTLKAIVHFSTMLGCEPGELVDAAYKEWKRRGSKSQK